MDEAIINVNLLKSQMVLRGISAKTLMEVQGWSETTTSRKINGKVAFKAPEVQVCVELLKLDSDTANKIFFAAKMS